MATKDEFIHFLKEAIDLEEKIIPILESKISICLAEIDRSEMIEEDKKRLHRLLHQLVSDADEHKKTLSDLIGSVREEVRDEY